MSYINVDQATARYVRSQAIRPVHALEKSSGEFLDETTNKLSYKPVWQVVKPQPVIPRHRAITGHGAIETVTTIRHDYPPKYIEKPQMIIPCGNIRTSPAPLDERTMTRLSYIDPGPVKPAISFKPAPGYCPPVQPIPSETTQKLSYQPFVIDKKELYPWAQRPGYKQPDTAMCGETTYAGSYMENVGCCVVRPIIPAVSYILPSVAEFADKTVYKESYLRSDAKRVQPILPRGSIFISDVRMSADTTTKLSYQRVRAEKRRPLVPYNKIAMQPGAMQSETTTRREYAPKAGVRLGLIMPCDNIRTADTPMEGHTTTGMSYAKPGVTLPVSSCKPVARYRRPEVKIDSETVNRLSYQTWTAKCKEELPWARRSAYKMPAHPMAGDTVYQTSYPAPGHYVEKDVTCAGCSPPSDEPENVPPGPEEAAP